MNQFVSVEKLEHWTLERLIPFAGNARTHGAQQIQQIAASIAEFGFVNPVLVAPDGSIIAGHGRVLAAKKLRMETVPVIVLGHLSAAQRRALVIADNQLSLNSSWDDEALRQQLASLTEESFPLKLIGFEDEQLAKLLKATEGGLSSAEMSGGDKEIHELPHSPVVQSGDVWLLGDRHKVLCCDSSSSGIGQLMGTETADLVLMRLGHEDLKTEERTSLVVKIAEVSRRLSAAASFYVIHDVSTQRELQDSLEATGLAIECQLIWERAGKKATGGLYAVSHEPVFFGCLSRSKPGRRGGLQSTIWCRPSGEEQTETDNRRAFLDRAVRNSSRRGDLVIDPFGGFPSLVMVSEQLRRRCYTVAETPEVADRIVREWQEYTGQNARRSDGQTFADAAADREARRHVVVPKVNETTGWRNCRAGSSWEKTR